jgi:hypothetical protein
MATRRHSGSATRDEQQRLRIAQEAARLMADEGIHDFAAAKRKAVDRLGLAGLRNLPGNLEIEQALIAHQQLFRSATQPQRLRHLRQVALDAMREFAAFHPRLVGPVLAGTADAHSPVQLHLFADTPEQLDLFLMERRIPYEWDARVVRLAADRPERLPVCRFTAGDVVVEMTVFPVDGLRQAPLSPVDGRPMRRLPLQGVEELLHAPD